MVARRAQARHRQQRRQDRLEALQAATQQFIEAETAEAVAEMAVEFATAVLARTRRACSSKRIFSNRPSSARRSKETLRKNCVRVTD